MDGPYKNPDKKIKQKPSETIYGIYTGILRAIKEEGIRIEKNDNTTIIDTVNPIRESYLRIQYDNDGENAEILYRISGKSAKEVAMGIGRHFPILEGLDKLVENLSYVEVQTSIGNSEKKCVRNGEYCWKIGVYIKMMKKPNSDRQDEIQLQPPTELGVKLAKNALEELVDLVLIKMIKVSVSNNRISITLKEGEKPIFIYDPSDGRVLHSYTLSGESAKALIEKIEEYIPLSGFLREAEIIRVTWEYTPQGYRIRLETEMEPILL